MFVCKIQEAVGIVVVHFNLPKKWSGNKYLMINNPNQIEWTDVATNNAINNPEFIILVR